MIYDLRITIENIIGRVFSQIDKKQETRKKKDCMYKKR
jgi:hypothetical protein